MNKVLLALGAIALAALLVVVVFILYVTPVSRETDPPGIGPNGPEPIVSGSLIRGAACEQDSDCSYALNAYPTQRCVSPNCPPEDSPTQPETGDPAYEWMNTYIPSCVNAGDLQNVNDNGEELQFDTREHSCGCEAIGVGPNGEQTSVSGQKVCVEN